MSAPFNLPLAGCAPVPLAHYLKALGILRLVAEQADPTAAGCWQRDTFVLHSALDRDALLDFFLHRYQPTPILAPWNGGSGFLQEGQRRKPSRPLKREQLHGCSIIARQYRRAAGGGLRPT